MIKKLSHNISCYLCDELTYDQDKKEVLSYGLQILLGTSFKIISILAISYVLGILKTTSISLMSFIIFRCIIGGTHYDTYNKCFLVSTIFIIALGLLGEVVELKPITILILVSLIYVQAVISTIIWVPAGTKKKAIRNKNLRMKMKLKSIILATAWLALIFFIKDFALLKYAFSSISGVFLAFFFVTPLAYKFTELKIK
jgi:accessory gene regulator B